MRLIPILECERSAPNENSTIAKPQIPPPQKTQSIPGQQQRVAILVNHPALVLADEPTGALDSKTSQEIMNLLTELNQQGTTIIVVTHDASIAVQTKRTIHMVDGKIVEAANVGMQAVGSNLVNTSTRSRSTKW